MDQDQGVGREVRRLREALGWSQTRLAVEAGMSVSGISMIENGHRNLSTATLAKLAEALGVEVRDLFPLDQAPLPDVVAQADFDAWAVTLEHYKRLRALISSFENLSFQERYKTLEESLALLQDLRKIYGRQDSAPDWKPDWELGLLHDAIHQAVLHMLLVCELEQERGVAGADVIDIEQYKARVAGVA
jgi:transcriptional regulator with XRE-family HTH domain